MAWCHIVWDSLPLSWASSNFSIYTCVSACEAIGQCLSASWVSPSVWTGSWDGHSTFSPLQSCKRYVLGTSSHRHSRLQFCRGLLSGGVSSRWTWSGLRIRAPLPSCFCRRLGCHLRNARTDDRGIGIHHPHFPQFPQSLHFHQLMDRADYVCSVPPPVRNKVPFCKKVQFNCKRTKWKRYICMLLSGNITYRKRLALFRPNESGQFVW